MNRQKAQALIQEGTMRFLAQDCDKIAAMLEHVGRRLGPDGRADKAAAVRVRRLGRELRAEADNMARRRR